MTLATLLAKRTPGSAGWTFLAERKQRSIDFDAVRQSVHNEIPTHTLHCIGGSSERDEGRGRGREGGEASVCIIRVFILQQQKQQQQLLLHLPCPMAKFPSLANFRHIF